MDAKEFWALHQKTLTPGVSKYALLRDMMLDAISEGHWKRGAQLPTEQEFARGTPFSLGTVQRALRSLVEDGVIVRRQGHGTFVADTVGPLRMPWHMRFVPAGGGEIVPTHTYALSRGAVSKQGRWSNYFPGRKDVFVIERRFRIANEFWVFNRFYGSASMLHQLQQIPLSKLNGVNLKELIDKEYKLPITGIEHRVRPIRFGVEVSSRLEVKKGSCGLLLEAVARTGSEAVYYQEFYVPESDYYLDLPSTYRSPD